MVVNEIVDLVKRKKEECLLFKVDFEKAYDSISWAFLVYMMSRMGFDEVWIGWIRSCLAKSSMSVLGNGSPTTDFQIHRGLKQGDPLAPFLFLIVAEGLAGLVYKAVDVGCFKGFEVSNTLNFSILQYANATILLGNGSLENLWSIKTIFRSFEMVSGLKVNFHKISLIGINLSEFFLQSVSDFLFCDTRSIPFKFLGIPVGANPRRMSTRKPVVDMMRKRLSSWSS